MVEDDNGLTALLAGGKNNKDDQKIDTYSVHVKKIMIILQRLFSPISYLDDKDKHNNLYFLKETTDFVSKNGN